MAWIQTFTGRKVDPLNITESDICIEDIAQALALKNRFGGMTREPYSVVQHSVEMATLCRRTGYPVEGLVLCALLHDAAEAYLGDICTPLKNDLYFMTVKEAHKAVNVNWRESEILAVIFKRFGVPKEWAHKLPPQIDLLDRQLCNAERVILFRNWIPWESDSSGSVEWNGPVWDWRYARSEFMRLFRKYHPFD